ncbi:MAG: DivIVA domain-containing protein, partial [Oscillospiraceae bacterium]
MLSPKEIGEKTFDKTFGIGYRMDDVDRYLEQIAASMVESIEIKEQLEKKLEVLAEKLTEYREDEESLRTALLGAQKLGDSVIRESKTKAEIIMRDATIKAEAMVNNAKRQIDREQESLN